MYPISTYYKQKYGFRVFKLPLTTGFPCPRREQNNPCSFCVPNTFVEETFSDNQHSITEQIDYLIEKIRKKVSAGGYIAYFQDISSIAKGRSLAVKIGSILSQLSDATNHHSILELIVATRPDTLTIELLDMLNTIKKPVTIEIGIQSADDNTLSFLNRGHTHDDNISAIQILSQYDLRVGVHIILGSPNDDVNKTIDFINSNPVINDVKIHHLAVFCGSKLAETMHPSQIISLDEYIPLLTYFIKNLRADLTISRLFTSNLNRHQTMLNDFPSVKRNWMNRLHSTLLQAGGD
jgi:hypothetical protein